MCKLTRSSVCKVLGSGSVSADFCSARPTDGKKPPKASSIEMPAHIFTFIPRPNRARRIKLCSRIRIDSRESPDPIDQTSRKSTVWGIHFHSIAACRSRKVKISSPRAAARGLYSQFAHLIRTLVAVHSPAACLICYSEGMTTPADFSGLIGIDLGTTFSCAARLSRGGVPQTIPNREGELITPSVVVLEDDVAIVGREAKRSECVYPDRTAVCVKREMGGEQYSRALGGRMYRPEVLSAMILKRMKCDFETRFGPVRQAVITVPAYFDDTRRKATQDAGRVAGLAVLDIINEPTAAALAFAFEAHRRRKEQLGAFTGDLAKRQTTALVYDLGGGTFDVSLVRMSPERFETIATDGDVRLGGRDWDERLVEYFAEEFRKRHRDDPRDDPQS